MAKKSYSDQFDDEEVLYMFRKHPVVMRKGLIFASLGLLAPVLVIFGLTFTPDYIPSMNQFYLSLLIGVFIAIIIMFPYWITWHFTVFVVTNQRFLQIGQEGFWKRNVVDIGIDKIQTVSYEVKGLEQTLLGFGTIVIQTFVGELVIHHVEHPKTVQKRLTHIMRELGGLSTSSSSNTTSS